MSEDATADLDCMIVPSVPSQALELGFAHRFFSSSLMSLQVPVQKIIEVRFSVLHDPRVIPFCLH